MRVRLALPALLLLACGTDESGGVNGPYTGTVTRYVVDGFQLPTNNTMSRELGDDLDGDGLIDNQLGMVLGTLQSGGNLSPYGSDMILSGVIRSSVEIQADDLANDGSVGVWYVGTEGALAEPLGGTLVDGTFVSNRARDTDRLGKALLHLPVFVDADPSLFEIQAMQIDLVPDGRGGFDGRVYGGVRVADVHEATLLGVRQLLDARPQDHRAFWYLVDANRDGTVDETDLRMGLLASLLAPDLDGYTGELLSFGFGIHLKPCADGLCLPTATVRGCFDRVMGGTETDVDCGGDSCMACGSGLRCTTGDDCQTGACDGGTCRAPTCSDGARNGFEADVDCSGGCDACDRGQLCTFAADCESGNCGSAGRCL